MARPSFERILLVASFLAAAVWFAAMLCGRDSGVLVLAKGLAVPALAVLALRRHAALLAAALLLHGLGDVLIEVNFLAGMAAFLIGHAIYTGLFLTERRSPVPKSAGVGIALLAILGAAALVVLMGNLEGILAMAVPIYAVALIAMASSAQLARRGQPWLAAGAWLFVASDLLLALQTFGSGSALGGLAVWPIYWFAQILIATAWLDDRSSRVSS